MSDHELLELAAKAAGIEVTAIVADGIPHRFGNGYWNPLTDDGDALRLAVKLGLDVFVRPGQWSECGRIGEMSCREPRGADILAATRRAIVRAAAETGKAAS